MNGDSWRLHEQLAADTHYLGPLPSAHLLLHRNARLHWFILVPETRVLDLLDLGSEHLDRLMHDAALVSRVLKSEFAYPRVNVGALGLLVPQLHLHVIGRRESDPCWPRPVWGQLEGGLDYPAEDLEGLRQLFADARD